MSSRNFCVGSVESQRLNRGQGHLIVVRRSRRRQPTTKGGGNIRSRIERQGELKGKHEEASDGGSARNESAHKKGGDAYIGAAVV